MMAQNDDIKEETNWVFFCKLWRVVREETQQSIDDNLLKKCDVNLKKIGIEKNNNLIRSIYVAVTLTLNTKYFAIIAI